MCSIETFYLTFLFNRCPFSCFLQTNLVFMYIYLHICAKPHTQNKNERKKSEKKNIEIKRNGNGIGDGSSSRWWWWRRRQSTNNFDPQVFATRNSEAAKCQSQANQKHLFRLSLCPCFSCYLCFFFTSSL